MLHSAKAQTQEALDQAIAELLPLLTAEDCNGLVQTPIYCSTQIEEIL
jgi:hypothetical protein